MYADAEQSGLYYIELKRADGTTIWTLVYELGWPKPRLLAGTLPGLRRHVTSTRLLKAYQTDRKVFLASFSSTLPAGL